LTNGTTALTVGGDGWAEDEGADYTFTGSQTLKGDSPNTFTYDLTDATSATNYVIITEYGKLFVIDRDQKYAIVVKANSGEFVYNGKDHSVTGFKALTFITADGGTYTVEGLTAEATEAAAGTYPVEITGDAKVLDAEGNDVTEQFAIAYENGSMEIARAPITITTSSASKEYDGTPLTSEQIDSVEGLPDDETLVVSAISFTGSQTEVGKSFNTVDETTIRIETTNAGFFGLLRAFRVHLFGGGIETTPNYDIAIVPGILEVTEPIVVPSSPSEETTAPADKETTAPADKETTAPADKETTAPADKETTAPADKETTAPADKETTAPADKETTAPADKETTAPADKETTAPADKETTAPADKETTASADKETTAPADKETTASADKETTAPTEQETTASTEKETTASAITPSGNGGNSGGSSNSGSHGGSTGGSGSGSSSNSGSTVNNSAMYDTDSSSEVISSDDRNSNRTTENSGLITIDPEAIPLSELPHDGDENQYLTIIDDEEVPLGALPKTGQNGSAAWMFALSSMLLAAFTIVTRKKEDEK
jgi:LPXTG-motif cell wall-anchored protein